jgi:hypothetical protein
MNGPVREFAEHLLRVFPEWGSALKCPGEGDTDDCSFCVVPPAHPTHRLANNYAAGIAFYSVAVSSVR